MKLNRVKIKNFRLLRDVELVLEDQTTLIVGRNNSGKTALSEIIRRFTSNTYKDATFQIQDFSIACYDEFCAALKAKNDGKEDVEIRGLLPYIELRMWFQYDPVQPQLGPLSEFIVDLDINCNEALVVMRFELAYGSIKQLFDGFSTGDISDETRKAFFHEIAERIPKLFDVTVWAEDPNDVENRKDSSQASVKALLKTGFINAQRGLDSKNTREIRESDVLAKVLVELFSTAALETADEKEHKIAMQLKEAVRTIQDSIDGDFHDQLQQLLPALQTLGYPGLGDSELTTETTLDVNRLLTNHTKVRYEGYSGVLLPESYNGLGMRNLIYILLQVVSFYREFRAEPQVPGVHLVCIEEPEAHLHPQVQEVFIRQLGAVVKKLDEEHVNEPAWSVQFLVSTHSSHISNEAPFEVIRYFLSSPVDANPVIRETKIKDLREGLGATSTDDIKFLNQYLTLTRCDLFFADKAILIEGTSERLMLPIMIQKHDGVGTTGLKLRTQYMTVMEVGGAYAHKFFDLLNFLELQSLVITDLDSVEKTGGQKCQVHQAKATSNACINTWFGGKDYVLNDLIAKPIDERVKEHICLAYQCPEFDDGPCGRTFEDAFLLANTDKFGVAGNSQQDQEKDAYQKASNFKKSQFALKYSIDDTDWDTPTYIAEGLKWLVSDINLPVIQKDIDNSVPTVAKAVDNG